MNEEITGFVVKGALAYIFINHGQKAVINRANLEKILNVGIV